MSWRKIQNTGVLIVYNRIRVPPFKLSCFQCVDRFFTVLTLFCVLIIQDFGNGKGEGYSGKDRYEVMDS